MREKKKDWEQSSHRLHRVIYVFFFFLTRYHIDSVFVSLQCYYSQIYSLSEHKHFHSQVLLLADVLNPYLDVKTFSHCSVSFIVTDPQKC